jgi:sugar fermentation stimulation protein A
MRFEKPLLRGTLIRRYKRFLADVRLEDGRVVTALCPNTGSMKTCVLPGNTVLLSEHDVPTRKYRYTWQMIRAGRAWIGINTGNPNEVVHEAILQGRVPELSGYDEVLREVPFGRENSRVDILLRKGDRHCYVEVKNVTLAVGGGIAAFPDSVTERGTKHLRELAAMARRGHRAVIFYFLGRADCARVRPADEIDPAYGLTLRRALAQGVEALAYRAVIRPGAIRLGAAVPFEVPEQRPKAPARSRRAGKRA